MFMYYLVVRTQSGTPIKGMTIQIFHEEYKRLVQLYSIISDGGQKLVMNCTCDFPGCTTIFNKASVLTWCKQDHSVLILFWSDFPAPEIEKNIKVGIHHANGVHFTKMKTVRDQFVGNLIKALVDQSLKVNSGWESDVASRPTKRRKKLVASKALAQEELKGDGKPKEGAQPEGK